MPFDPRSMTFRRRHPDMIYAHPSKSFLTISKGRSMSHRRIAMSPDKKIALVAHDNKKRDLLEWARFNRDLLAHHDVFATGTTGELLENALGFEVKRLQSGPLGGDQQIGARIVDNEIDFLIFFWDPLEPMPHDPDVKALLRMAVVWNIPIACNRASADFMISSPLMDSTYHRLVPDYAEYRARKIESVGSEAPARPDAR
jgi:methylglyoxal synthase